MTRRDVTCLIVWDIGSGLITIAYIYIYSLAIEYRGYRANKCSEATIKLKVYILFFMHEMPAPSRCLGFRINCNLGQISEMRFKDRRARSDNRHFRLLWKLI